MLFLYFPRFAGDADYTFAKLRHAFPELDAAEFARAFASVAKPELISRF